MKNVKYLILPDVHGRDFWMKPVEETLLSSGKIVFLGDYLDPYPYEWEYTSKPDGGVVTPGEAKEYCRSVALDRFKQILEIKKQNPERVTLLLGNHDCGYAVGDDICSDRMDRTRRSEIDRIFQEERNLFQLAEECICGDRKIIFSHAGILKGWADLVWGPDVVADQKFNVVDRLNNAWFTEDYRVLDSLAHYDGFRGYLGYKYGSPVWSDIRSWEKTTPEETFGFNIAGHTQVKEPLLLDTIAGLDCHRAFFLDEEGKIHDYGTGEEVKPYYISKTD